MKIITLTRGYSTIVDDTDYESLIRYNWFVVDNPSNIYAARKMCFSGKHYIQYMHRQILNVLPYQKTFIDHVDSDGLNNQRSNIRLCSHSENMFNKRTKPHSSQYRGVTWNKKACRWFVGIKKDEKSIYLGSYTDEVQAAKAYDDGAKHYFGSFARLNFPSESLWENKGQENEKLLIWEEKK